MDYLQDYKKIEVTIIYEDKESKIKFDQDSSLEDAHLAITCACESLCDSEFEILDLTAKIIDIESLKEIKDKSIFFLRKKKDSVKLNNTLLDSKRKLLVEINPMKHLESMTAIKNMIIGSNLLKHSKFGFPHIRLFQLSQDFRRIIWYSKTKPISDSQVSFDNITDIVLGQTSETFMKYPIPILEEFSFTLYYNKKNSKNLETLDITCKDSREFDLWLIGIKALHAHFNNKLICKNDLLNHSRSYCEQVSKGNIGECSKYLVYNDKSYKTSQDKTLENCILKRDLSMKEMYELIMKLVTKYKINKEEIDEITDEFQHQNNVDKNEDYQEIFNDETIADDVETQKIKMCNLLQDCEKTLGIVIHEFLWYSDEYRIKCKLNHNEDEYDEFSQKLLNLEIEGNIYTTGKSFYLDKEKINVEFFLKELDIKLWKLEIDLENVGDIMKRFKNPPKKGYFDFITQYF